MRLIFLVILLAGCSLIPFREPGNIQSACSILRDKPLWKGEMRSVERKWGVPMSVQMAIIYQESKFEATAKTPMKLRFGFIPVGRVSSAYGYAQVIDGTWDWYKRDTGRRSARRNRYGDAVDFIGWYSDISNKKLGISKADVRRLYLAYHEGHSGYQKGSHLRKKWLLDVARNTEQVERKYRRQLRSC